MRYAARVPVPIVHHPGYVAPLPAGHRFPMAKFGRLIEVLRGQGLAGADNTHSPDPAPRWWLELAHDPAYVAEILDLTAGTSTMRRIGLPLSAALALRARLAVAGTVLAGELALKAGVACNTAGGSHHAGYAHGAGFCVFNDVAVAARVLQALGLAKRILVLDLDVHQGDGTAEICRGDDSIFTFSLHCEHNYPARKQQSDLDIGLDEGTGDDEYLAALTPRLSELLDQWRPDLVFYNAGVDPHRDDRLGKLALSDQGLMARERLVVGACGQAQVPLATVIGGGYAIDIDALARRHALISLAAAEAGAG